MTHDTQRLRLKVDDADRDAIARVLSPAVAIALGLPFAGLVLGATVRVFLWAAGF